MSTTDKINEALDSISHEVAEILRKAGVRQSMAYSCADEATRAVEKALKATSLTSSGE